jgi:Planctomycete cytochrome C
MAAILFCATFVCAAAVPTSDQIEFFETKIRPVLASECYQCHSTAAPKLKGKLRLDSREGILKGGESDLPAVVPGKIDDGQLLKAIRQEEEGLSMPPAPKRKLAPNVIADFEAWAKMGAPMPASSGVGA